MNSSIKLFLSFLIVGPMIWAQDFIVQDLRISDYIEGTLITPNKPSKTVAIIIPGSGPTDRDGNQNFMQSNALKYLAQDISEQGIATFRYDKRALTMLRKGSSANKIDRISFDDFIADAKKIVQFLKQRGFEKIVFVGHSQGALVAMLASEQDVDAIVSLAGAGRSIDQVIMDQLALMKLPQEMLDSAQNTFNILKTGKIDKNFNPGLANIFNLQTQPFMASWMKYNPAQEIAHITLPLLIINGTKDIQVYSTEAEILHKANSKTELKLIPDMNHALKIVESDDPQENVKRSNMPQLKNHSELAPTIVNFIKNSVQ